MVRERGCAVFVCFANEGPAHALIAMDAGEFATRMQSTPENPLLGVNERCGLLQSLGRSLLDMPEVFGTEKVRPGNIVGMLSFVDELRTPLTIIQTIC
jgi:hypothetical protein